MGVRGEFRLSDMVTPAAAILLISDDGALRQAVTSALSDFVAPSSGVVAAPLAAALSRLATNRYDAVLVDADADGSGNNDLDGLIGAVLPLAHGRPIVVLDRSGSPETALTVLRAGAQEHVTIGSDLASRLPWAIRCAAERQSFIRSLTAALQQEHHDSELRGLKAMCGPAPLAVSARSFGSTPLAVKAPSLFEDMVRTYQSLLDSALEEKTLKGKQMPETLNELADQLGTLDASPRDIVELHKAAINAKIDGQTPGKAKAYVEEGRLLMVRLMGLLASFYRTLSWGSNNRRGAGQLGQPMAGALPGKRVR